MAVFRLIRTSFGTLGTLIVALLCVAALSPAPALAADSTFTINGRGWGHGIGLSQYGAKGYADQGKTYDWILRHYFQKTGLSTRVELTVKVDLDSGKAARTTWDIAAGGSTTMTVSALGDPTTVYAVPPKTRVWVAFKDGTTRLYKDRYDAVTKKHSMSTTLLKAYPGQVVAATGPQSSSMVKIMDQSGPFAHSGIVWRGIVRFSAASDTTDPTINYVGMENYLRGVVPRESPSSWPPRRSRPRLSLLAATHSEPRRTATSCGARRCLRSMAGTRTRQVASSRTAPTTPSRRPSTRSSPTTPRS